MNTTQSKILTWLVVFLLVANIASIAFFWFGKPKPSGPPQKGNPAAFLINELKFDSSQQVQFETLRKEHHDSSMFIRDQIKEAKKSFFNLLKEKDLPESTKEEKARAISINTEKLDLLTFNHFQKLRAICDAEQQIKFDKIILDVVNMINQPVLRGIGDRPQRFPQRDDQNGKLPPEGLDDEQRNDQLPTERQPNPQ